MAKGSLKKSLSTAPSSIGKGGGKGVKDGSLHPSPAGVKGNKRGREHGDDSLAPSSLGGRAARVLKGKY